MKFEFKKIILLIISIYVAIGLVGLSVSCSNSETKQFNATHIESPFTQEDQLAAAKLLKRLYELKGYDIEISRLKQTNQTRSMGQALSNHAYLVYVIDFDNTSVNDVVSCTFITSDHEIKNVVHQVVLKNENAMRLSGMNNAFIDDVTIFKDNYKRTLVGQFYYRSEID